MSPGAVEILYPSSSCMGDIPGMPGVTPGSVADPVNYLEREGQIRRVGDPLDHRRVLVVPAIKGELRTPGTEEQRYDLLAPPHPVRLPADGQETFADPCARFSGVGDACSFTESIAAFGPERGRGPGGPGSTPGQAGPAAGRGRRRPAPIRQIAGRGRIMMKVR
ncbi:MAG TPA: MarR family winged helix-turn-helix transcriptional regulator [Methanoregulaceae archaeon]|nr:MarR family winged helix-turn-helix transcriptional regulator [Methanoregulaceae archaeon]